MIYKFNDRIKLFIMEDHTLNILLQYPTDITELCIKKMKIKGVLDLSRFTDLIVLNCSQNLITSIINIPDTLYDLDCYKNEITQLDLPTNLTDLNCGRNKLNQLTDIPSKLIKLNCSYNRIQNLRNIPPMLKEINYLSDLPIEVDELPKSLVKINYVLVSA